MIYDFFNENLSSWENEAVQKKSDDFKFVNEKLIEKQKCSK